MKKTVVRLISLVMGAVTLAFCLVSCGKQPYDYNLDEYVTVPADLSGITVTESEIKAEVEKSKNAAIKNRSTTVLEKESGATNGNILKLSFKCFMLDGTEITELSDEACTLVLGENKYPVELEAALLGQPFGKNFDVTVTLPQTFTVLNLAGQKIKYVGKINEVLKVIAPEYNNEFVQSVSPCQSTIEYEQYLYEKMKEELIFKKILESSTVIQYPQDEYKAYVENFVKYYTEQAEALKITLEEYVYKKFFININEFKNKENEYAKELVKKELVLYSLARKYSIELSDEEYRLGAEKYTEQYGLESVSNLESRFGTSNIRQTVLMDKVLAYLAQQIKVTQ